MIKYLNEDSLRKEKARLGFERVKNFNHENYKTKLLEVFA